MCGLGESYMIIGLEGYPSSVGQLSVVSCRLLIAPYRSSLAANRLAQLTTIN